MILNDKGSPLRVAILDMNNGEENQGMRSIGQLIRRVYGKHPEQSCVVRKYEVRQKGEVPGLEHDVYISSGGPGSPLGGKGTEWEAAYFSWLNDVCLHNRHHSNKKHALFICYSFQMMARFFGVGQVTKRPVQSFGIFTIHRTAGGQVEPLFEGLPEPFFAADFRRWQVVQPRQHRLNELGASVLAIEQPFEEVDWERAVMGIRISPEIVGFQFHPEADPEGMLNHFGRPEQRKKVVRAFCEERYQRLMTRLREPDFLMPAYDTIIPTFLQAAIRDQRGVLPAAPPV